MKLFKVRGWLDLLIHLLLIGAIGVILVMVFFYAYLPVSTNHGETITVPDVTGVALDDLDDFLEARNLRFEVTEDSGFSSNQPPLSVLKQFPLPNSKVKENRKIYVSLNAENAPLIRMPNLVGGSIKNAQLVLKTYDLKLGKIAYVEDLAFGAVMSQKIDGREVLESEKIPKGSVIDLTAGNGLGRVSLESPNLLSLDLESAQFAIIGSGLEVGDVTHEKEGKAVIEVEDEDGNITYKQMEVAPGAVFKQRPTEGRSMRIGQTIDLWIYSPDSLNTNPTLLDEQ